MKIAGQRGYLVMLESVAMTDIVLNMFIFFFISFSLLYTFNADRAHSIKIVLPAAGNAAPLKDTSAVRVTVTVEGEFYVDARQVTEAELRADIARRTAANPDLKIVLRSDAQAPFEDALRVLSIVSEHRIRTLDIAVAQRESAPPPRHSPRRP